MNVVDQTKELVALASPSHESNHQIADLLQQRLDSLGFEVERVPYRDRLGVEKVNLIACKGLVNGRARGLAYFAHTDVVPADTWTGPNEGPFQPAVCDGRLYGRGSCDMKGSIACLLAAVEGIEDDEFAAPLYVVLTADEEVGYWGAREVVAHSRVYRQIVERQPRVVIGEPTGLDVVYAHKGICGFTVTSHGRAAHSSTRHGLNANLALIPFLQVMKEIHDETESLPDWQNEEFDPPTVSWNIGIRTDYSAVNVKTARSVCTVFFRPLPGVDDNALLQRSSAAAEQAGLDFQLDTHSTAVYTDPQNPLVLEALELAGREQPRTVSYGTDGGELTELQDKIVCGPGDIAQAHTTDEWVDMEQLTRGKVLYEKFLRRWCCEVRGG